jgi:hypothetical protein
MSLTEMDRFAQSLTDRAGQLSGNQEDATCLELHQVVADLDAAWWAKFQQDAR